MDLNIIKIGSNVLTDKNGGISKNIIKNLCNAIAKQHNKHKFVIISSGAACAGKEIASNLVTEKNPSIKKRMLVAIGQPLLTNIFSNTFMLNGINIAQILVERRNLSEKKTYIEFRDTLNGLINNSIIPILNENDVMTPVEWKFGENDHLATLVAIALKAKRLIICTDVDGLFSDDPRLNKKAKKIDTVKNITKDLHLMAKSSSSGVGLGGMISKIQAVKLAIDSGIESYIINGNNKNAIHDVLNNRCIGTKFVAKKRDLKNYQRWLAAGAHTYGQIIIDEGAKQALIKRKSLLMVGVKGVNGEFKEGDVVDIVDTGKTIIGVGIANYNTKQIKTYFKRPNKSNLKEVIHCDELVLM